MNPKIGTFLGSLLLLACAFAAGYFVWNFSQFNVVTDNLGQYNIANASSGKDKNPRVCTQEAKQCADGSFVSRTGSNCEFAPCGAKDDSDCVKEGESIGAVYPGVKPKECCAGLVPKIPEHMVGTQGICTKEK